MPEGKSEWRQGPEIRVLCSADALGNFTASSWAAGSATDLLSCPKPKQLSTFLHTAHRKRLSRDAFKDLWCQMKWKGKSFLKISFQGHDSRGNDGLPEPQDFIAIFTASLMQKKIWFQSHWQGGITLLYRWNKKITSSVVIIFPDSNISFRAATFSVVTIQCQSNASQSLPVFTLIWSCQFCQILVNRKQKCASCYIIIEIKYSQSLDILLNYLKNPICFSFWKSKSPCILMFGDNSHMEKRSRYAAGISPHCKNIIQNY